jgi:hypothetical protein
LKTKALKLFILLALVTAAFSLVVAAKTDTRRAAVEELLVLTKTDQLCEQMFDQMKPLILQQLQQSGISQDQSPLIKKYLDKIFTVMKTEMSWDKMKDDYIRLYLSVYTEPETRELIKFYKTPIGQKTIEKTPLIMQQSLAIGQKYSQNMMPKIQAIIQELVNEISKESK